MIVNVKYSKLHSLVFITANSNVIIKRLFKHNWIQNITQIKSKFESILNFDSTFDWEKTNNRLFKISLVLAKIL